MAPGEQYAYDRTVTPQGASAARGRQITIDEGANCPKAIINDRLPSVIVTALVIKRGLEAFGPPGDPQWSTYPVNSQPPYPQALVSDSPIWNFEEQLIDGKLVYSYGFDYKTKFDGGFASRAFPGTWMQGLPSGSVLYLVYRGSDNFLAPNMPRMAVGRIYGYMVGNISWQYATPNGEPEQGEPDYSQSSQQN